MHVLTLEEGNKYALQIIFDKNEAYVSETFDTEKAALKYFKDVRDLVVQAEGYF